MGTTEAVLIVGVIVYIIVMVIAVRRLRKEKATGDTDKNDGSAAPVPYGQGDDPFASYMEFRNRRQ